MVIFVRREIEQTFLTTVQQRYLERSVCHGDLAEARSFVEDLSPENRRKLTEDSYLMSIALHTNKPEFIRFLVEECYAEIDKFTTVVALHIYPRRKKRTFTPLCYAAKYELTEAAAELMRLGADLNGVSAEERRTALHFACLNENLTMVKDLIQHGADLNIANKDGWTALMYAEDNVDTGRILIENGIDVNATNIDGNTALHLSAPFPRIGIVKLLIENGADPFKKNNRGEDALCRACQSSNTEIVKAIIDHLRDDDFKRETLIRTHKLLGACYLRYWRYDDDHVSQALIEWETAIRLRDERRHNTAEEDDAVSTPHTVYDNAVEIDSISKLDEIRQDKDMIYMQGLLLKEKILGPTHLKTIVSVIHFGEFFNTQGDYGRGLRLLEYGFKLLCRLKLTSPHRDDYKTGLIELMEYFNVDTIRHSDNIRINFNNVYEFLETVTLEARRLCAATAEEKKAFSVYWNEIELFMRLVLFLTKLFCLTTKSKDQTFKFRKLVRLFIRLNLRTYGSQTLLLYAIYPSISVSHYLQVDVIQYLLECGIDATETDDYGNSVLHILEKSSRPLFSTGNVSKRETQREVAELLLSFGAHFDKRNKEDRSAAGYLQILGLDLSACMTLEYIAAQTVRRHRIPCAEILPKSLIALVEMH